jgi:hypothetical protein
MADSYNFDQQSAQRIVRAVRTVERTAGATTPGARPMPGATGPFYAKIVGESTSKPGNYSWKVVDRVNGAWVDRTPRVFDSGCSAVELNGTTGLAVGTVVRAAWAGELTAAYPTDPSPAPAAAGGNDTDLKVGAKPWPSFLFEVTALPQGQYPDMFYGVVTTNQMGFMFVPASAMTQSESGGAGGG